MTLCYNTNAVFLWPEEKQVVVIANQRLILSLEHGENILSEIFTAFITALLITPWKSHLREKSFNSTSSISLLLGGCRGKCMYVYDIGADRCSTVHRYGHSMNTGIQIYRYGPFT